VGYAAGATRMVRPHPAQPPRHRRCARLRQRPRQTLRAVGKPPQDRSHRKHLPMKFTLDWLKDHLETTATAEQIGEALTMIGLEVEEIVDPAARLRPFVVAYVASAEPHPNSDHLKVCKVDAGTGTLIDVVCGAPNARTGMKSVFAFPGTYIPGKDFEL